MGSLITASGLVEALHQLWDGGGRRVTAMRRGKLLSHGSQLCLPFHDVIGDEMVHAATTCSGQGKPPRGSDGEHTVVAIPYGRRNHVDSCRSLCFHLKASADVVQPLDLGLHGMAKLVGKDAPPLPSSQLLRMFAYETGFEKILRSLRYVCAIELQ
ncbi:hypothetical protein E2562_019757 [Oryza meyeriana var. granulata]|uniref:Uncharacterized protein n=1 Tax=Oryza meyeriana var. granulata TaxID=110450 RepID=A0A6G1DJE1_9ORYZ|nr:hypothetical protein E2562_019757 [Oryza meyeriana var. granulata]